MEQLSVIIITFNEEDNVSNTIDAAWKVADEIIIVDSGSTDRTEEICKIKGTMFIHQSWLGYGAQRNFAVGKSNANYILVLDADEIMDDELIKNIVELKETGFSEKIYSLRRRNSYYGKFIRHGVDKLEVKPRLYHKDFAKWDNKLVHENLQFSAGVQVGMLKGYLLHYTYKNISEHIAKMNRYSTLSAQEYYTNNKPEPGFIKLVLSPAFTFINAYIFKGGFLDGWHGWLLAKFQAKGVLLKYAKLKMLYRDNKKIS
jgi:glycosyltransferase involved in cell wall biosynthesis